MLSDALNSPAAVIGDLVASRRAVSRGRLHTELIEALDLANSRCHPVTPLLPTVGDEFQGVFPTVTDAVRATLLVRIGMESAHDARFGIGVGEMTRLDDAEDGFPRQDGPGWWAARDAVNWVAAAPSRRGVPHSIRTHVVVYGDLFAYEWDSGRTDLPGVRALNTYLATRDHLVGALDERDRRILRALLLGRSLSDVADYEGVSRSAVTQRVQRSGIDTIVFAEGTHS